MNVAGKSFIGVVAQQPFETLSAGDTYNSFCTLQPISFQDGTRTTPDQFPNNGLVWWMLRANAHRFATPGQLVAFVVEDAIDPKRNDPSGNLYQAVRASVEPCALEDVVEILTVPSATIERANDLVSRPHLLTVDHPPCGFALVRWRSDLYGPLRVTHSEAERPDQFRVSFSSPSAGQPVFRVAADKLDALIPAVNRAFRVEVSIDAQVRDKSREISRCEYELIPGPAYEQLAAMADERVLLQSDSEILRRVSKGILTRRRRQELSALLAELEQGIAAALDTEAPEQTREVLAQAKRALAADEKEAQSLAEALIESGLVDKNLDAAIEQRIANHIESRASSLTAEIEERVAKERAELNNLTEQRAQQKAELESQARRAREALERELARVSEERRAELDHERADLTKQAERLEREREVLEKRLEAATLRFTTARDEVVNDFLALVPLLSRSELLPLRSGGTKSSARPEESSEPPQAKTTPFRLRPYLSADADPLRASEISELEFFDRFVRHTEASGYVYRRIDLASFHISAKTCDLTVLGGVSGTGKSSLPRLYAEALAGEDSARTARYQLVGVNPSWLDVGDLLGRVNALDGRFQPSESGLYTLLVHAHEEYRRWAGDSGIYMVCLDEMNLAHVEHYFSLFLQVLESPLEHRRLRCFSPEVVLPESDFAKWATVDLPASLRFVGTVNFDETTKPLSLRVLDRVNLIKLRPGRLSEFDLSTPQSQSPLVNGPPVTTVLFESWKKSAQPGRDVAELLDAMRAPLADLGCPLSPRRYRALCQFLASAPRELVTPVQALDLQITQRLLPQIRGLFRREAQEAVESLVALLEKHEESFTEALQGLEELRSGDYQMPTALAE